MKLRTRFEALAGAASAAEAALVLLRRQWLQARQSQQALALSAAPMRPTDPQGQEASVIHGVPALIAYVDAQQRYVYVNHQYQQRFAPQRDNIIGCSVREILGPERYAVASPMIAQAQGTQVIDPLSFVAALKPMGQPCANGFF